MKSSITEQWTLDLLHKHLQYAVDLELWTIPFYMAAMYSVVDPGDEAYQLILSVVNEEMLHVQLASNVANAFGLKPSFMPPVYKGKTIPHLDFDLDDPNPTDTFNPYTAEIGPLDAERINAMCLIEFPEWDSGRTAGNNEREMSNYGSIGEFYDVLRYGVKAHADDIKGGVNQVNLFQNFYQEFEHQTVSLDGEQGLKQVLTLIDAITDQGEGQTEGDAAIPKEFQNTSDDAHPDWTHYKKFLAVRDQIIKHPHDAPKVYAVQEQPSEDGKKAQKRLKQNFCKFLDTLEHLFSGGEPENFAENMYTLGGNILTCWKNGVVPQFPTKEEYDEFKANSSN